MESISEGDSFQVGGHSGKLSLVVKESIIYKPDTEQEADFYETAGKSRLAPYMPEYYGREEIDLGHGKFGYFKMENTIHSLHHPCIIDLKMGTRTWFEDCSKKKLEHKKDVDRETTSLEYGLRFCGMKIYDERVDSYVQHEKVICKEMHSYDSLKKMIKVFLMAHGSIVEREKIKLSHRSLSMEEMERALLDLRDNDVRNKKVFVSTIDALIPKLEAFKEVYDKEGYQIISSSLFMFYDRDDPSHTIDFKMIDFAHWKDKQHQFEETDGYSKGIETIIQILRDLRSENYQS